MTKLGACSHRILVFVLAAHFFIYAVSPLCYALDKPSLPSEHDAPSSSPAAIRIFVWHCLLTSAAPQFDFLDENGSGYLIIRKNRAVLWKQPLEREVEPQESCVFSAVLSSTPLSEIRPIAASPGGFPRDGFFSTASGLSPPS